MANGFLVVVRTMPSMIIDQCNELNEALKNSAVSLKRLIQLMVDDENSLSSFLVDVNGFAQYEIRMILESSIPPMLRLHIDHQEPLKK